MAEPHEIDGQVDRGQLTTGSPEDLSDATLASDFLDIADYALTSAESYASSRKSIMFHRDIYRSVGFDEKDMVEVYRLGCAIVDNIAETKRIGTKPPFVHPIGDRLHELVGKYQDIEPEVVVPVERQQTHNRLIHTDVIPTDIDELEKLAVDLNNTMAAEPYLCDANALTGIAAVHLAKFFSRPDIHRRVAQSGVVKALSYNTDPLKLATDIILANLDPATPDTLQEILTLGIYGSHTVDEQQLGTIQAGLSAFHLTRDVWTMQQDRKKVLSLYGLIVANGIRQSSVHAERLADTQPTFDDLADGPEAYDTVMAREADLSTTTKAVASRAVALINRAARVNSDIGVIVETATRNKEFPVISPDLARWFKQQEPGRLAGIAAVKRATMQASKEATRAELDQVRAAFILQKAAVKRRPGNNDLTRRMLHKLRPSDVWEASALHDKEDAYVAAGLLFKLCDLMDKQPNNSVFGSLLRAIEQEREIASRVEKQRTVMGLEEATQWLLNEKNLRFFRESSDPLLKKVGDGAAAYQLALLTSTRADRLPERNVSVATLLELEKIRHTIKDLDIPAFPPNHDGRQAVHEDALGFATDPSRRGKAPEYDERRLDGLMDLADTFFALGYNVMVHRLKPGSLKQKFPYYALVIELDGKRTVVNENPVTDNATIVFDEINPTAASWEEMVLLDKKSVNDLGGRAMYHSADKSIEEHMARVKAEVLGRLEKRGMVVAA